MRASGTAALVVTHDLDEALYLSDRVLLMAPAGATGAGRIARELEIAAPHPRARRDSALAQLRGTLLEALDALVEPALQCET